MLICDFHIHSTFSDGKLSIPQLVDFYGSRGFGAIAITDHLCEQNTLIGKAAQIIGHTLTPATYPLYLEILRSEAERAREQYGMIVLPGFELSKNSVSNSRSAHILGIGTETWVSADHDAQRLCAEIRAGGGISVAAHPVSTRKVEKQTYYLWDRREELRSSFDAWEVASGRVLFREVLESGLPMIASSDLHRPEQIHAWKTVLHCEKHPEAIKEAIRKHEVEFRFYREEALNDVAEPVREPRWMDPVSGNPDTGDVVFTQAI